MQVFFDRTAPFFIVDEPSFDATPVEVDADVVKTIRSLRNVVQQMNSFIEEAGAPEDTDQNLAISLSIMIKGLLEGEAINGSE